MIEQDTMFILVSKNIRYIQPDATGHILKRKCKPWFSPFAVKLF